MSEKLIEIRHLRKQFGDNVPLKDVNAVIGKGEVICIIGPSGTGKSTLLRCINLLETPTSGQIFIDGEEITAKGCRVNLLRRRMGMVFQSFNLFAHKSIIENIMLGPEVLLKKPRSEAYERGMELLRSVGLADRATSYPDELSGGQKQRAAIARTLAMEPEIVLFDEPTSALDPTMVSEVLTVIRGLARRGLTMLIVTHEMKFARDVSSRIFYMDEGVIYEDGVPEQIFDSPRGEKTRQFIQRLKVFDYTVTSRDFDFIGLNTSLEEFGRHNLMMQKTIFNLQLIVEELCVQTVLPHMSDDFTVRLSVEYSGEQEGARLCLRYSGDRYEPAEEDGLSMLLVKNASRDIRYTYTENENRLDITVK